MTGKERLGMVAPCGIDCGICELAVCGDSPQMLEALVSRTGCRERSCRARAAEAWRAS